MQQPYEVPSPPTPQPKPGDIVLMASGAVMLIFSFFEWLERGPNAWSGDTFPLFTYVPLFGLAIAGATAARVFGRATLPADIIGFTPDQLIRALAIFCVLLTVGVLLAFEDVGVGLIFNLLGSIGLVVGSFLTGQRSSTTPPTPPQPPTTF